MSATPASGVPFGIFFPFISVALWVLVVWIIAQFGWANLAAKHRAGIPPTGPRFSWCSMRIAPFMNYNTCLNVTLAAEGIFLVPFFPFRFAHPVLLIPWECVVSVETTLWKRRTLSIKTGEQKVFLYLPKAAGEWIEQNRPKTSVVSADVL